MKEIKLLWLTENYYPNKGGMAQSCDRIVRSLRALGIRIDIVHFTNRRRPFYQEQTLEGSYSAIPLHEDPAHCLQLCWNYIKNQLLPNNTYSHLVVFGGFLSMLAAPIFQKWLSCPLICCIRGNDFDQSIFAPRKRSILKDALLAAKHICCVSQDKVAQINLWLATDKAIHTPNGILLEEWKLLHSHRKNAQKWRSNHVAANKRVVGLFGHLKAKKGTDYFLQVLAQFPQRTQLHLLLIGTMEKQTADLLNKVPVSYTHLPFMDRYALLHYYPACDLIAIPSHYDGMPNVLLEAGALEIPCLVSKVGGLQEVIEEGKNGWLFTPNDQAATEQALYRMMTCDGSQLQQMGVAARAKIIEHYDHQVEADRYLSLLYA